MAKPSRSQYRQPRLAELVADALRGRILRGELADNAELPKQEELFDEFGVSMPSIREALRILETEGLITVRRGNRGGAVVHRPQTSTAGYMFGLVLQSREVPLVDLAMAVRQLDPLCAAMCAERKDRKKVVVPGLRTIQAEARAAWDDFLASVDAMKRFHEHLVATSGNQTLILLIGTLESIWYAHEQEWASKAGSGEIPADEVRRRSLDEHDELIEAIADGDAQRASDLARSHQEHAQPYATLGAAQSASISVDAQLVRAPRHGLADDGRGGLRSF